MGLPQGLDYLEICSRALYMRRKNTGGVFKRLISELLVKVEDLVIAVLYRYITPDRRE